jgi:hypothetical protein
MCGAVLLQVDAANLQQQQTIAAAAVNRGGCSASKRRVAALHHEQRYRIKVSQQPLHDIRTLSAAACNPQRCGSKL